jgi:hypothetical protein
VSDRTQQASPAYALHRNRDCYAQGPITLASATTYAHSRNCLNPVSNAQSVTGGADKLADVLHATNKR